MSTVLVTGCAGFIGMHCAERLLHGLRVLAGDLRRLGVLLDQHDGRGAPARRLETECA